MKYSVIFTTVIALALYSFIGNAGNVTGLTTYVSNTVLNASDLNNDNTQIKNAVDGNADDISINTINIGINSDNITALQNNPVTPWTVTGSDIYFNTGNVGIGTTSPLSPLHIVGNRLRIDFISNNSIGGIQYVPAANTGFAGIFWVTAADGSTIRANSHYDHTNQRLYVTNAGTANLTGVYLANGGTSWTTTSDRRLKENINDTTYGLDTILQIPVREYNFKNTTNKQKKIGFIAQEIYPIVPEIVTKGDEGEFTDTSTPWGIDIAGLTPILIKSIQELRQIVEMQQVEIEALKAKVDGM